MQFLQFVFVTIILLNTLYSLNGIPTSIISNRDDNSLFLLPLLHQVLLSLLQQMQLLLLQLLIVQENLTRDARNAYDDLTSDEHDYWQEFLSDGVEHPAVYMPKKTTQSS
uniref:Uncharacterized protein n=1 Tax=Strongyloides stercoralis TaxID=6248 RepID=A0AAF5I205_STRER